MLLMTLRWGWLESEPTYEGKTVTQWLDTIVLKIRQTNATGVSVNLQSPNQLTNQPGFQALLAIGSRAVPVLMQRIMDLPEEVKEPRLLMRWKKYWQDKWRWIRSGVKPRTSVTYPVWQRDRKDVAGVVLIAIGTNAQGGFARYLEAYAEAPKVRVTGPLLGVVPGDSARTGAGISAQHRAEVLSAITAGMQHADPEVRRAAVSAAREFPEEAMKWKSAFLTLAHDSDSHASSEALFALMETSPDIRTMAAIRSIADDQGRPEQIRGIARLVLREWDRKGGR